MQFWHPAKILKAEPIDDRIHVEILASTEDLDNQGERVLKSAFSDKTMQNNFLKTGYYDYNHLTDLIDEKMIKASGPEIVALQKAKAEAIIGYPETIAINNEGVVTSGYLIGGNTFVEQIRKGLESGFEGWGASICGFARPGDVERNVIKALQLRKVGFAPLQECINPHTSVRLLKSSLSELMRKAEIPLAESITEDALDLQQMNRKLNFVYDHFLNSFEFQDRMAKGIREAIQSKQLGLNYDDIVGHLMERYMLDRNVAGEIANGILKNSEKIVL